MSATLELAARSEAGRIRLLAPEVGLFTCALPAGQVVVPGQVAGTLISLGRSFTLLVPEGASGVITSAPPARIQSPVGYGDVLYEIAPHSAARAPSAARPADAKEESAGPLVLRSPQAGRFYHRPSPTEPPFVAPGRTIEDGQPVGMIEVMKTFSHVAYRAEGPLPRRARVVRIVAADGSDVRAGDALLELEPI